MAQAVMLITKHGRWVEKFWGNTLRQFCGQHKDRLKAVMGQSVPRHGVDLSVLSAASWDPAWRFCAPGSNSAFQQGIPVRQACVLTWWASGLC
eukprot:1158447-Pelagomonas_calceolata.AAC.6